MSGLPLPAAPAAPIAPAGGDARTAEPAQPHDPAFAAVLTAALVDGRARATSAPRAAAPSGAAGSDVESAGSPADDGLVAAGHDVLYHAHTTPVQTTPDPVDGQVTHDPSADVSREARGESAHPERGAVLLHAAPQGDRRTSQEMRGTPAGAPASTHAVRTPPAPPQIAPRDASTDTPLPDARLAAMPRTTSARAVLHEAAPTEAQRAAHARAASPTIALRDPALLLPEFRDRLDRVIARLETLGHTVTVLETYRGQDRQDHLYAQGRTRPGDVVTWTRHSQHSSGRAADLLIDGSFEASPGYARLAQIAAEEGLRTLGARDPGHVELPGGPRAPARSPAASGADVQSTHAGQANVARVAAPASVAAPAALAATAPLAAVAAVARPGSGPGPQPAVHVRAVAEPAARGDRLTRGDRVTRGEPAAESRSHAGEAEPAERRVAAVTEPTTTGSTASALGGERDRRTERGDARPTALAPTEAVTEAVTASSAAVFSAAPAASTARTQALGNAGDADIAGRVARVLQLQADAAAQPLTRVSLQLGDDGVDMGRVRIDLRGGSVDTAIEMTDPLRAAELRSRIHELQSALQQRGLEATRLNVRTAAAAATAASAAPIARVVAGEPGVQPLTLESLISQLPTRPSERQADGGRHGADGEQRRPRSEQQRQEAK